MDKETYDVGYKKPPLDTKFKKGKSGNPSGRKKGRKNKKDFYPLEGGNIFEFLKKFTDAGHEEILVIKDGQSSSMSKMEALIAQLYNKAMNGNLGAAKILLQYADKSLRELGKASDHVHKVTLHLRDKERRQIFNPPTRPKTRGAVLENLHELYSARFAMREIFGKNVMPVMADNEPNDELDWPLFNHETRQKYLQIGHEEAGSDIIPIPSVLLLHE